MSKPIGNRINQINIAFNGVEYERIQKKYINYQRECVKREKAIQPISTWARMELLK